MRRATKRTEPIGKAVAETDQDAILKAAAANRSKYALPYLAIGFYTGFRASEVRTLRWRQVDFMDGWVRSELSKTPAGELREVPLLPELRKALLDHRAWIERKLGAPPEPDHFVFPFANRGKPVDPERPCTNIASAWWSIREKAGVTCRLHDLRHTYVTRLLEAGATDALVRELVGHVDERVIERYTHIRRGAKKEAVTRAFGQKSETHVKESPKVEQNTTSDRGLVETDNSLSAQ